MDFLDSHLAMGVGLGGRGVGYHGYLGNLLVLEEAEGDNYRICISDTNGRTLYRRRADGEFQYVPKVVVTIPHP